MAYSFCFQLIANRQNESEFSNAWVYDQSNKKVLSDQSRIVNNKAVANF